MVVNDTYKSDARHKWLNDLEIFSDFELNCVWIQYSVLFLFVLCLSRIFVLFEPYMRLHIFI